MLGGSSVGAGCRRVPVASAAPPPRLWVFFVFPLFAAPPPIFSPAGLRVAVPYHPLFYAPLALLHFSLIIRLAGDAAAFYDWRSAGGALNALALLAFIPVSSPHPRAHETVLDLVCRLLLEKKKPHNYYCRQQTSL